MRWCFFSPTMRARDVLSGDSRASGGAEAQVAYLSEALACKGHEVSLIYGNGDATLATDMISGVACIDAAPEWNPKTIFAFWQTLKRLAPDVIYARLPSDFLWMIRLYARQSGSKFIYAIASTLHCDPWTAYDYNRWFHAPAFALGLRGADIIAVQHEQQVPLMCPLLQQRAVHVPNLVRSFRDLPRSFDQTVYDAIWIGMIRPEKQIHLFLDLVSALPKLHFAVVGGFDVHHDAGERRALEQRMRTLPNLSVLGPQRTDAIRQLLAQSKVLVNTSSVEGFPNTMLEAWSAGVPVVSMSIDPGGTIEREGMGRLSGTATGLAYDVSELATNCNLNLRLGSRGLDYVRRTHGWEDVYSSLIGALPFGRGAAPVLEPN